MSEFPKCDGSGTFDPKRTGHSDYSQTWICPVCKGEGCEPDAQACPRCSRFAEYKVRCSCADWESA